MEDDTKQIPPPPDDAAGAAPSPGAAAAGGSKFQEGPVQLPKGAILGVQWRIVKKLGEGGCGAVYLVESTVDQKKAALKAESNFVEGGSVLKLEVDILSKLKGKKHVCEFIHAGRKDDYQYIVMSLLGDCVADLVKACGNVVSVSTQLRMGVHVLHGLKQIHDAGFVHRDVKPANLALGNKDGGTDPNFIYVLDFGLSRSFVKECGGGKIEMRKPRKTALFRGTTRYCSVAAHLKHDQSRVDDLWSLLYVLVELRGPLPWAKLTDRVKLAEAKQAAPTRTLFGECPGQMREFEKYLQTLNYFKRPDYTKIHALLMQGMKDGGYKFSDPWDWQLKKLREQEKMKATIDAAKAGGKPLPKSKASLKSVKKAVKSAKSEKCPATDPNVPGPPSSIFEDIVLPDPHPFTDDDFATDPLGI